MEERSEGGRGWRERSRIEEKIKISSVFLGRAESQSIGETRRRRKRRRVIVRKIRLVAQRKKKQEEGGKKKSSRRRGRRRRKTMKERTRCRRSKYWRATSGLATSRDGRLGRPCTAVCVLISPCPSDNTLFIPSSVPSLSPPSWTPPSSKVSFRYQKKDIQARIYKTQEYFCLF